MATTSIAFYAFECGLFDFVIRCGRISTRIRDFRSRRSVDHREGTRRGLISLIKRDEETPRRFPLAIFHASWQPFQRRAIQKFNILDWNFVKHSSYAQWHWRHSFSLLLSRCIVMLRKGDFFFFKLDRLKYYILLGEEITLTVFLYQFKIVEN